MLYEIDPTLRGKLSTLPPKFVAKLVDTYQATEREADGKFMADSDERKWISTYNSRILQFILEGQHHLEDFSYGVQSDVSGAWTFVTDRLIDPDATPIDVYSTATQSLIDHIRFLPTVLSPNLYMRCTHFSNRDKDDFSRTLVGRDFCPGGERFRPI